MNELFLKGNFEPINDLFIKESRLVLKSLAKIQKKFNKGDMDTLLNELHDSIVGKYLGFELVNTEKHGFDCKLSAEKDIFLESKVASYSSNSWSATFNDTTYAKADAFRTQCLWLALSIWTSASDILCICYGKNQAIGDILEAGVTKHRAGETVRSTQSISMSKLLFEFNFKILSPFLSKSELLKELNMHGLKKLDVNQIVEYKDFESIFD